MTRHYERPGLFPDRAPGFGGHSLAGDYEDGPPPRRPGWGREPDPRVSVMELALMWPLAYLRACEIALTMIGVRK